MYRRSFIASSAIGMAGLGLRDVAADDGAKALEIIDCHTHFYDPTRPEGVPWPGKDTMLYRTVLPEHLRALKQFRQVTGTVIVEASPWVEDNQWLLDLARGDPFIVGIVGNLKLGEPDFAKLLKRFASNPLFRGIRVNVGLVKQMIDKNEIADFQKLADLDLSLDVNGGPDTPAAFRSPPKAPSNQADEARQKNYAEELRLYADEKASWDQRHRAAWDAWRPAFGQFDVVLSNYNGQAWPQSVKEDFVSYVREGGGFVCVDSASEVFADWPEYNAMTGLGGWGGRTEKNGPMMRLRKGAWIRDETPGRGGSHGIQHEFMIDTRAAEHPIMAGLPPRWRHAADSLYATFRGPAAQMTILASAYSSPESKGTDEHEPLLMAVHFGKGRVFNTLIGHSPEAMQGAGFQVTLLRGSEWAATGTVTIPPDACGTLSATEVRLNPMQ